MELNNKNEAENKENKSTEVMQEMINESLEKFKKIKRGDIIKGKIIKVNEDGYLVDMKDKMEGYLPKNEPSLFSKEGGNITNTLEIEDEVYVFVDSVDEKNENIILSKEKAKYIQLWGKLNEIYRKKEKITAEVIEKNPNGLIVNLGVKGFVPKSQIESKFIKDEDLDKYIGKKLDFIIIKLDEKDNQIVLSHRLIVEKERKSLHKKTMLNLKVEDIKEGIITNITNFGAFVDIGGVEGLLHISEITWRDMKDATKLLKVDDKIKVKIIDFNQGKDKISLSIKKLSPDPWENIMKRYSIGDEVEGKVITIKDFGAFIEIEEGVNGLLHISEMAWAYVKHPSELIKEGELLKLRILEIEPEKKKISLGLKQLLPDPWENIEKKYPLGSVVQGKITQVTSYGANVDLETGINGVVHLSEIDWKYVENPSTVFKKYMVLPLKVLKIDKETHLIFLSRKRTLPNPWDEVDNFYQIGSTVKGKVTKIRDFGAFIKLDKGIEGFVPVSEIDWNRIKHPNEKLKKDEEYEFKIINIDKDKLQLTLSKKILLSDPWLEIKKKYPVGTLVEGKVVNITNFGAFIRLEDNIDGLVPLSEISHDKIDNPTSLLSVGQEVLTLVTKLDGQKKKISLSIRKAEKEEQKRFIKEYNRKQNIDKISFGDLFGHLFEKK
jgi:small subunit ribosomal protein S1